MEEEKARQEFEAQLRQEEEDARVKMEEERKRREEEQKRLEEEKLAAEAARKKMQEEEDARRLEEEEAKLASLEAAANAVQDFTPREVPDGASELRAGTIRKQNKRREQMVDNFLSAGDWGRYPVVFKNLGETIVDKSNLDSAEAGVLVICGEGLALQKESGALLLFYRYSRLWDFACIPSAAQLTTLAMQARPSRGPVKSLSFTVKSGSGADASVLTLDCHLRSQVWMAGGRMGALE